jgi:HAD superfamily hydrolase (TIGR01549 family)
MVAPTFVWDFDGTLVDTRERNFNVVRRLLAESAGRALDGIPALASPEIYDATSRRHSNWRELYAREFGLDEDEVDRLGRRWSEYQLKDDTPSEFFEGIGEVLLAMSKAGQGIVSQNAHDQIARTIAGAGLSECFRVIVGYDDVGIARQKPEPDGLLMCLEKLDALGAGCALYIGDHEADVRCARNAQQALAARGFTVEMVSVAACFDGHAGPGAWTYKPDYVAWSPREIIAIAKCLDPWTHGSMAAPSSGY